MFSSYPYSCVVIVLIKRLLVWKYRFRSIKYPLVILTALIHFLQLSQNVCQHRSSAVSRYGHPTERQTVAMRNFAPWRMFMLGRTIVQSNQNVAGTISSHTTGNDCGRRGGGQYERISRTTRICRHVSAMEQRFECEYSVCTKCDRFSHSGFFFYSLPQTKQHTTYHCWLLTVFI